MIEVSQVEKPSVVSGTTESPCCPQVSTDLIVVIELFLADCYLIQELHGLEFDFEPLLSSCQKSTGPLFATLGLRSPLRVEKKYSIRFAAKSMQGLEDHIRIAQIMVIRRVHDISVFSGVDFVALGP